MAVRGGAGPVLTLDGLEQLDLGLSSDDGRRTDVGLLPFQRHPADLLELTAAADQLERLADHGVDQRTVTDRRLAPGLSEWCGLAAPELRATPVAVREQVLAAVGGLAWASGSLRFWSEQVRGFNARVDGLAVLRQQARARRWGIPEGDEFTQELALARIGYERELAARWWEAHQQFIEDGSRAAAAMLREGPTADRLAALTAAGVWRAPSRAVAVFLPQWQEQAMQRLAEELAGLAQRIDRPGYRPSEQEIARLAQALTEHAADPVFAYHLLSALTPAGLLRLVGEVSLLQVHNLEPIDQELAAQVSAIQTGLGVALATATARRGSGGAHDQDPYRPAAFELPAAWVGELVGLGREQIFLTMPLGVDDQVAFVEVYGHQLIGVLLQSPPAEFDASLLTWVGGDMLDFETRAGWSARGEGVPIWLDARATAGWSPVPVDEIPVWMDPLSDTDTVPVRLNWIAGSAGNDGYDPLVGVMDALSRDRDAAREFFTSQHGRMPVDAPDGAPPQRLPRVDYLLTDRIWPDDETFGRSGGPGQAGVGQRLLVEVLVDAATEAPDHRGRMIAESVIYELAVDEQARGWPNNPVDGAGLGNRALIFSENTLIPADLREPLAGIAVHYIDDLFWSLGGIGSSGELADGVPGTRDLHLLPRHTQIFLAELGKDPTAREALHAATASYTTMLNHHYLSQPDVDWHHRLHTVDSVVANQAGLVLGAVDFGYHSGLADEQQRVDADENRRNGWGFLAAELTADTLTESSRIPRPVGTVIREIVAHAEEAAAADRTGAVNHQLGDGRHHTRQLLADITDAAVYQNLPPELAADLPDRFFVNGDRERGLLPMSRWDEQQSRAWTDFKAKFAPELSPIAEVPSRYDAGYNRARGDLEAYR